MACRWYRLPNGTVVHLNVGRTRSKRCSTCGEPADKLCDHVIAEGKTCDAAICAHCALHREPDSDFCKEHAYDLLEREAIKRGE
jgi:hypothetical protein